MTIVTIILGLVGLGIVVFFHELGHFLAARMVGVEVEEFSLGWGPRLLTHRLGRTKYSISALPIGGYCRMKGEDSYRKAIESGLEDFPKEPGSFFGAPPVKRIIIALGGPLMNVVLAFFMYLGIMSVGYSVQSWDDRIILASSLDGKTYPADTAGLRTGDRILEINGERISTFSEIQESVALSARRPTTMVVDRDGSNVGIRIIPELDKDSGAGRIGIYPWIEPLVASVDPAGAAAFAGIQPGDTIVAIDGTPVDSTMAIVGYLTSHKPAKAVLRYMRAGVEAESDVVMTYGLDGSADLGLGWKTKTLSVKARNPAEALSMGFAETGKTISATYRGIASLFMGTNVLKAISGPVRITWMVGTVAASGFSAASTGGLSIAFNFLAALSIGLFAMNLLPIPLLDGGSIVLYLFELVSRKAAKVKTVLRYQTIGMVAVAALFILSTLSDVLFFSKK
ncbi:MAG TPA: RIP metalloprotease RseP [bacterium]|nr:RIP metalloprotease RseP [bacterium]